MPRKNICEGKRIDNKQMSLVSNQGNSQQGIEAMVQDYQINRGRADIKKIVDRHQINYAKFKILRKTEANHEIFIEEKFFQRLSPN